jgi:hypothetical protein
METTSIPDLAAVVARLDRLEKDNSELRRQNRRLKCAGAGVLLLGAIALLAGAGQAGKTVEAERFVLRDGFGRQRAVLSLTKSADDPSVALMLFDTDERPRAGLGVNKDGPGLYFTDPNGKHRAVLSRNNDGIGLDLLDDRGRPRAGLHVTDVAAGLTLRDEAGAIRMQAGMDKDLPTLMLNDEDGKLRAGLQVEKKAGRLRVLDAKGKSLLGK